MARYIDADAVIKEIEAAQDSLKSNNDVMWEINKKYYKGLCMARRIVDEQPTAAVVPKSEVEQWYHEYHAIRDELKQEKMYHRETEKLADRYCAELQTAKSEVERLEKALADKARECNMAVDKICLAHRKEIISLQMAYGKKLAETKNELEQLIYKLECLLCHATGGKLSKHTYDLRTMESAVNDHTHDVYLGAYAEAKQEVAMEIFAEIEENACDLNFYVGSFDQLKEKYTNN